MRLTTSKMTLIFLMWYVIILFFLALIPVSANTKRKISSCHHIFFSRLQELRITALRRKRVYSVLTPHTDTHTTPQLGKQYNMCLWKNEQTTQPNTKWASQLSGISLQMG